jgi:hypothetical protein
VQQFALDNLNSFDCKIYYGAGKTKNSKKAKKDYWQNSGC